MLLVLMLKICEALAVKMKMFPSLRRCMNGYM